jgi:hypothetical protein
MIGVLSELTPTLFGRINDTYNTDTTIKDNLKNFLNGMYGESASSNQKSQCVLLSVILYVISKIYTSPQDGERIDERDIYDSNGNFKEEAFNNKTYSSSDLENRIIQYKHNSSLKLDLFYNKVCKSGVADVIPYNALISFNVNDTNYIHKSFVTHIKPVIKDLIYNIFSTLRLNNSGIISPKEIVRVDMGTDIIKYDRTRLEKSHFKFLQSDNIQRTVTDTTAAAQYNIVDHEIIDDAISDYTAIDSSLNDVLVPDFSLNRVLVSSICNTVSTMSYLVYLPTYHVATYDFGDANLQYFGAYDPDPDCIKLEDVPPIIINAGAQNVIHKKDLRDLNVLGRNEVNKRLKENYKYSYHRIHVWLNKPSSLIYFAIRGTHSSRDWQHSDYLVARGEGHRMDRVDIIDDVLRQVYSDMGGIWGLGNNEAKEKYKLIITGHSLGGNLTNITKVLTHKNRLYEFTDTFTNGFPISCQPYYSTKSHSDEHFKILNWAFSQDKGLVLNVEYDGAAELLITKKKAGIISKNLIIFEATRTTEQKPIRLNDNSNYRTVYFMKYTHSLYNFFGKRTWEEIMNHHTQQILFINGDVSIIDKAGIGKYKKNYITSEGSQETIESSYIKYGDYEGDSKNLIETNNFILTTNFAVDFTRQIPDKNVSM